MVAMRTWRAGKKAECEEWRTVRDYLKTAQPAAFSEEQTMLQQFEFAKWLFSRRFGLCPTWTRNHVMMGQMEPHMTR